MCVGIAARETAQALKTLAQAARGVAASTTDPKAAAAMLDSARDVMEGSALLIHEAKQALISPGDTESQQRLAQVRHSALLRGLWSPFCMSVLFKHYGWVLGLQFISLSDCSISALKLTSSNVTAKTDLQVVKNVKDMHTNCESMWVLLLLDCLVTRVSSSGASISSLCIIFFFRMFNLLYLHFL